MRIVLASASPRRRELISEILGIEAEIIPSSAEENAVFTTPGGYVLALARLKAEDIASKCDLPVVGADTVVYNGKVLGKPESSEAAAEMLRSLSGITHEVYTGVCVAYKGKALCRYERTEVTMKHFTEEFIEQYIASGSPMDKAGAYGLQDEMLAPFIAHVRGCRSNVIGLPVSLLTDMLKETDKWQR